MYSLNFIQGKIKIINPNSISKIKNRNSGILISWIPIIPIQFWLYPHSNQSESTLSAIFSSFNPFKISSIIKNNIKINIAFLNMRLSSEELSKLKLIK